MPQNFLATSKSVTVISDITGINLSLGDNIDAFLYAFLIIPIPTIFNVTNNLPESNRR